MRKLAAVLTLCLCISVALAGPLEDGGTAMLHGDYVTALKLWRPLADQGSADAQFSLGMMYGKGKGVTQDYTEALKWYRKAADQGNAWAQFSLGIMYYNGQGVPQNHTEALKWYRKAADQGNVLALHNLGPMY